MLQQFGAQWNQVNTTSSGKLCKRHHGAPAWTNKEDVQVRQFEANPDPSGERVGQGGTVPARGRHGGPRHRREARHRRLRLGQDPSVSVQG